MDTAPSRLAQHDCLARTGELSRLLPGETTIGGLGHEGVEIGEHRLSHGELPQMVHFDSLPAQRTHGKDLPDHTVPVERPRSEL